MSSESGERAKKRRVDSGGGAALSVGQGEREGDDGLARRELMSMMNQLLDQNRLQMAEMKSMGGKIASLEGKIDRMEGEMKSMRGEMKNMRGEINDKNDEMETSARFDHVDIVISDVMDKLNYHEVMLESQKWEYSAPYPNSVSNNSTEKHLLDQIKEQTCDMKYGKCNARVRIDLWDTDNYNAAAATFLPHWREFANALEQYQYALKCLPKDNETFIELRNVQLPKTVLDLLSNALKSTHFKSIKLEDNQFGRDGIQFALNYLEDNKKLEELRLISNQIDNDDDVNQLCEIIRDHPTIKTIVLDSTFGEGINGHDVLCSVITAGANRLRHIDLCSNEILTGGSTFIADFLATNPGEACTRE